MSSTSFSNSLFSVSFTALDNTFQRVCQWYRCCTAWKLSKYGVFSGPNTGKYGPKKTPYLDTFHAVMVAKVFALTGRYFQAELPHVGQVGW